MKKILYNKNRLFLTTFLFHFSFLYSQWAYSIGGFGSDQSYDITDDLMGNVYITGSYQDTLLLDFDPGPGIATLNNAGDVIMFFAKYNFFLKF